MYILISTIVIVGCLSYAHYKEAQRIATLEQQDKERVEYIIKCLMEMSERQKDRQQYMSVRHPKRGLRYISNGSYQ